MAMISLNKCKEIAAGKPDISSAQFRNAVGTMRAMWTRARSQERLDDCIETLNALLAHGEPVQRRKLSKAELSAIRREASAKALVARSRAALAKRLQRNRKGMTTVTDRHPAIFDAALEMIEDGELRCFGAMVENVYPGPEPEGGRPPVRHLTVAAADANVPSWAFPRDLDWKSSRKQEEQRI
jgi:hypothetical protein